MKPYLIKRGDYPEVTREEAIAKLLVFVMDPKDDYQERDRDRLRDYIRELHGKGPIVPDPVHLFKARWEFIEKMKEYVYLGDLSLSSAENRFVNFCKAYRRIHNVYLPPAVVNHSRATSDFSLTISMTWVPFEIVDEIP